MKAKIISVRCPDGKLKDEFKTATEGKNLIFNEVCGLLCSIESDGKKEELGTIHEPKFIFNCNTFEITGFMRLTNNFETFQRIQFELKNP
jgi:hypothetical protein